MTYRDTERAGVDFFQRNAKQRLITQKEKILKTWLRRVYDEMPNVRDQERGALMDSIPDFLDHMIDELSEGPNTKTDEIEAAGEEHGRQRAMMGKYSLEQIIGEYNILSEIILHSLEEEILLTTDERDIILNSIATGIRQAASIFVELTLLKEERNRVQLRTQHESARILGESGTLKMAIPKILKLICEGLNWNVGLFWEVNEKTNTLHCVEKWVDPDIKLIDHAGLCENVTFTPGTGFPGHVWQTKKAEWITTIEAEQRFPRVRNISQIELQSAFGFPVTIDKNVMGVLEFFGDKRNETDSDLLSLMTVLGVQIGQFMKRKRGEISIQEEVVRRSTILDVSLDCIISLSSDGKILEFNPSAEKTFGFERHEVIGKELADLIIPPYLRARHREGITRYIRTREAHILRKRLEFPALKKDGSEVMVEVAVCEVPDSDPPIFTGFLRDITEQKHAENALKESENLFRTYTEEMPQKAYVADPEGNIVYYNQRYYEFTGKSEKELLAWSWEHSGIIHPDDLERSVVKWHKSLETGQTYENEHRLRSASGEFRWHLSRAIPVRDDSGKILKWVGTETDIEDQKRNSLNLEQEKAVREQFVATLTHDLRNPLSTIKSNADLILKFPNRPQVREMSMARILAGIDRTDRMIRNLLDANLIQAGKPLPITKTECELTSMTKDIVEELKITYGDRFILNFCESIHGFWSPEGVRRIIENLLSNACKYSSPESSVTITLNADSQFAKISVHNFGKTISPEELKALFEPFKRTRTGEQSGKKGWGLGLSLVKGITEAHGGQVFVTSDSQEGTNFTVSLPLR